MPLLSHLPQSLFTYKLCFRYESLGDPRRAMREGQSLSMLVLAHLRHDGAQLHLELTQVAHLVQAKGSQVLLRVIIMLGAEVLRLIVFGGR